jgi:Tfp pilus assembly protein PilF
LPLGAPQIQQAVLQRLTRQQVLGISTEVDRVERERLQEANALLRRGEYWEVPLRLLQLLARNHAEDTHVAEVFKLLAVAYVAVGQTELAVKSFREALLREPGLNLDVVTTSPKVMRAFVDAKSGQRQVTP